MLELKKKSQGWNLRESLVFLQEAVIKMYVGLCWFILGGCYQVSDCLELWTANVLIKLRGFITLFGIGLSSIDQVVLVSLSPCWRLPHHTHTCTRTHMLVLVGGFNKITSCTQRGDSHRIPLRCLKAVDSESRHRRQLFLQQLPHPGEMKIFQP